MAGTFKFVIVGHVDHGKSTLIGRLLADTGSIASDRLAEVNDQELAHLLDHLEEEREQGITIDTTQTSFRTEKREYVIIDAPGHVEFLKNMVTGASQADAAVLIVDAVDGVKEQTRRHASILAWLGIKQILVVVNKMDLVGYSQAAYEKVREAVIDHLAVLGIKATDSVPISAKNGVNIIRPEQAMSWYTGKCLLEVLDNFCPEQNNAEAAFVFPVQGLYKGKVLGRVCSGSILSGDQVKVLPAGKLVTVRTIDRYPEVVGRATKGESVALSVGPDQPGRGAVLAGMDSCLKVVRKLKAQIFWLVFDEVGINDPLVMRCATQQVRCRIRSIKSRIGSEDLRLIEDGKERIREREVADVEIIAEHGLVASSFNDLPELGRFVLEKDGRVCAGGIIQ